MKSINELIEKDDWTMFVCQDRDGRGAWAAVTPGMNDYQTLIGIINDGDIENFSFCEYVFGEGQWLPIALGVTAGDAIKKLDAKLGDIEQTVHWKKAVCGAFSKLEKYPIHKLRYSTQLPAILKSPSEE